MWSILRPALMACTPPMERWAGSAWLMAVVALAVAAVPVTAQEGSAASGGDDTVALEANLHPLQAGDMIRLQFWREPDLSGEYAVDERGATVLPILGERHVTGISAEEMKRELEDEYAQHIRDRAVQITLLRRVTIFGAVNQAGLYHLEPTMTVADAVALAGGSRPQGQLTGVKVFRGGEEIRSHLDSNEPVLNTVRSGDQIFVPERSWAARNTGVIIGASLSAIGLLLRLAF